MKSTKKNKKPFTFEDFEKGLMLAGYISPASVNEIKEREILEKYEKEKAKEKKAIYFKRVVLAAEILNQLHMEFAFGRIKFQKLVYLCENVCDMQLNERYAKFAAGPFDHKFMHSINAELKKQKWFKVEKIKDGKYNKSVYSKLKSVDKYKGYYENYFAEHNGAIQRLIELFRKRKTDYVELVATIFHCILELNEKGVNFSEDDLFELFYSWSKEKKRFSKKEVLDAYKWMVEQDIIPC